MSETDLATRVATLEEQLRNRRPSRNYGQRVSKALFLLLLLILTANLWMAGSLARTHSKQRLERQFWVICQPGTTDAQRREAFAALVQAGNREWRSARLMNLRLRGIDLERVELESVNMEGCDLTNANLTRTHLAKANMQLTKLVRAQFCHADLSEAYLFKVDLTEADLTGASLPSASLEQSDLVKTNLEWANLAEANLLLAVLTQANLRQANLSWANLDAADLTGANLEDANLLNVSIRDTKFANSNWWRASGLKSATLERFKKEFAPSDDAPAGYREDFEKWKRGEREGQDDGDDQLSGNED